MAFSRMYSAQTELLSGRIVTVEIDTARGLNNFTIVGLEDRAVDEARDRVASALKNSGFESPKSKNQKTVVSLSPADLKKEGAHFDLSIAIGFLLSEGMRLRDTNESVFVGELGLDGVVRGVRGILPIARTAARAGFRSIYVPKENADEATLVEDIAVFPVETLCELVDHLRDDNSTQPMIRKTISQVPAHPPHKTQVQTETDLGDIIGQESAKRGLLIAAAGGHNILMYGPPGTGKTMLARALAGILPELTHDEAMEVASIHSIAGTQKNITTETGPPFRSPHHTSSYVSIIGGGASPRPGEATLAHRGVLFLDEFPEFDRRVIEGLREPLEEQFVSIARAKGTAIFPAAFLFVAAMNPCPCGWKGSKKKSCTCTAHDLARYKRKLSGPLLDRIDMALYVGEIAYEKLAEGKSIPESGDARMRVEAARARAYARTQKHAMQEKPNGQLRGSELPKIIPLQKDASNTLNECAARLSLSARAYHRVQKLARTIADIEGSEQVTREHVLEAIRYRPQADMFT